MATEHSYENACGDHGGTNRHAEPCGRPAGWGTDFDDGKCKHHRGTNADGSSHEGNNFAAKTGAWAESFLTDFLRDDEIERVMNASDIIGEPEGAQDLAQKVAVVCLEQFRRTGDQRFLQRYESICDKANLFPDDDAADVNISLDDLYE